VTWLTGARIIEWHVCASSEMRHTWTTASAKGQRTLTDGAIASDLRVFALAYLEGRGGD
jgi:hypothetical protein